MQRNIQSGHTTGPVTLIDFQVALILQIMNLSKQLRAMFSREFELSNCKINKWYNYIIINIIIFINK